MIYVTVGSAEKGAEFDRLIKKIDVIAKNFSEGIIMQLGSSSYIPKNVKYFNYCSYEESLSFFKKANLVIGHCGSGTIINALSFNTPLIVIPRRISYGELDTDDHQLELAKKLEKTNYKIIVVHSIDNLEGAIKEILKNHNDKIDKNSGEGSIFRKENLIQTIKIFIKSVKENKI